MISLRQEELNTETWRKQPAFDNLAIFLYSYSNQPGHPKYQPIQNNAISWLLFKSRFKYILLPEVSLVADLAPL
jgi:hypothetical protein